MAKDKTVKVINEQGASGFAFFAAWLGAVVYFVGQVDGFWNVILAFLKACIWPAYVLYHVLELLRV
jgi:hypothetical protein